MSEVNSIPFAEIPENWAFDPVIGPFVRDLLDVTFQLRERTGGNSDLGTTYLLLNGSRPMTGNLSLGGNDITNVGLVDGRNLENDGAKLDTLDETLQWLGL